MWWWSQNSNPRQEEGVLTPSGPRQIAPQVILQNKQSPSADHFPLSLPRIIELNGGQPPLTYKRFQTLISRLDPPEMPVETLSDGLMGRCVTPVSEDHGDKYGVPSLEELGEKPGARPREVEEGGWRWDGGAGDWWRRKGGWRESRAGDGWRRRGMEGETVG